METAQLVHNYLLYFILPVWIAAGFGDYVSHRRTDIARTSGSRESILHLVMVLEIGLPLLLALIFEINALILAIMLVALVVHEVTGLWDLVRAHHSSREVRPLEQHVHSFLEVLPLMAVSFVALLNWEQFLALLGIGEAAPDFTLSFKRDYWQTWYGVAVVVAAVLFAVLPFVEELWRCRRAEASGERRSAPAGAAPGVRPERAAPGSRG